MKKKNLSQLKLNKKSISNLRGNHLTGGTDGSETLINFNCRLTNASFCHCPTDNDCTNTKCHTVWDCEL